MKEPKKIKMSLYNFQKNVALEMFGIFFSHIWKLIRFFLGGKKLWNHGHIGDTSHVAHFGRYCTKRQ